MPLPRLRLYRGWWIVAAGFLSQMVTTGATTWVLSVLILPMQHSLGWSRSEIVGPLTLLSLISGTLSAALGPLMDRHGTRLLMTLSALLGGACLFGIGFISAPWQYYLLFGVGIGLAAPALQNVGPSVAIANWFVRRRAQAFATFTMGSATAGIVLAPLVSAAIHFAGWQAGWQMLGLLEWCVVPLAWIAVRRRPEEVGLLPDGDPPDARPSVALSSRPGTPVSDAPWTVRSALHARSFWLLTAAFTLTNLPASSILVHMEAYLSGKGLPAAAAVAALSIYGFGVLAGRFLWAWLIARLGMHRALIAFGFSYGASIVAFLIPSSVIGIYLMTICLGFGVAGQQQLQPQSLADYFGRRIVGSLLGYAGLFFMVSRAIAPVFAAFMFDRLHSYVLPFSLFALACVLSGLAFLLAPPPHPAEEGVTSLSRAQSRT